MRDFEDSTLWRISAFERVRRETGDHGYVAVEGRPSALPTTLISELRQLERQQAATDVLEVVAACLRQREPALLYLQHEGLVWPVTLFPVHRLYHCPSDMTPASEKGFAGLSLVSIEPPGVPAPGAWMYARGGHEAFYRPLVPWLWNLALHGPRHMLLAEIAGTAAYRLMHGTLPPDVTVSGALGSAVERLRRESVPLRTVASWPGMSVERASRLLNALYLASELMVSRAHPAARGQPRGWLGWRRH